MVQPGLICLLNPNVLIVVLLLLGERSLSSCPRLPNLLEKEPLQMGLDHLELIMTMTVIKMITGELTKGMTRTRAGDRTIGKS